ncbi:MAG TPA: sugar transporter, partial [Ignavibacteria bacterium]|nr:sugar transporter [Ignavibacteria bacterium]
KLLSNKSGNMELEPGDKIYIYKADVNKVINKFVKIEGEVRKPGQYPLNSNMTVMDLIIQAGGFLESSLKTEAYVNRLNPEGYQGEKISETHIVKLPNEFNNNIYSKNRTSVKDTNSKYYYLQHRDIVVIRKNPNWEPQRTVTINGEVVRPGVYVLKRKNETLLGLLKEAGGPTDEGFLLGANFKRGNKRVVIDLEKLYYDEDNRENILLKNSDVVSIPKTPNTVLVTGEVNNPGLYKFLYGEDVKDYIDKAGGTTDSSDYILYQKPTGETDKVGFGLFSSNPEVFDGSIINVTKVIPEPKGKPFDLGGTIKDVFAIAVSALTVIILAKRF